VYRGIKKTAFTVRASQEQARRWAMVARYLGCRSVPAWLEELAEEQSRRLEEMASNAPRRTPRAVNKVKKVRGPYRRRTPQ
jgi:hypothetical protein